MFKGGFIFLEVIFLSLVVSFTAMTVIGYKTIIQSNQISAVRTAALNTAQAQMAEIEYYIYKNKVLPNSFDLLETEFLKQENFFDTNNTLYFKIDTQSNEKIFNETNSKEFQINIKVYWKFNDKNITNTDSYEEISKNIWISTK